MRIVALAVGCLLLGSCSDDSVPPPIDSWHDTRSDGVPCTLGQPDSCSSCDDVCPGSDNDQQQRICEQMKCGVACKGHYYDVDGELANGCEASDDLPMHDTAATGKELGEIGDCDSNTGSVKGVIPSDDRDHLSPPTARADGLPDFFLLDVRDDPGCVVDPLLELDASALPVGTTLHFEVTFLCLDGSTEFSGVQTVAGGERKEISLDPKCPGGNDGGTLTIEVRKTAGPHSTAEYTINYRG